MASIILKSLFPTEKGDFNSKEFEDLVNDTQGFYSWLFEAFNKAYIQLNSIQCKMCKRVRSANIHEFVFNELQDGLIKYSKVANNVKLNTSNTGNERNLFILGKYAFIIKKEDASTNDTDIAKKIKNQDFDLHIITIEYTPNSMDNGISYINLSYYKGKTVIYSRRITQHPLEKTSDISNEERKEIEAVKPRFKSKIKDRKSVQ